MKMDEQDKMKFLGEEYLFLQAQYEDFDRRSLSIKGWVGGSAVTALSLSFSSSYKFSIIIPIFVVIISAVCWYIEAKWKMFQYALADRIRVIEAFFRADPDALIQNPAPFQIFNAWFDSYVHDKPVYKYEQNFRPRSRRKKFWRTATQKFVMVLYLAIIVLSSGAFFLLLLRP